MSSRAFDIVPGCVLLGVREGKEQGARDLMGEGARKR